MTIVLSLAIASGALGVLRATLVMLAAQLSTAFVVDWIVQDQAPSPGVIVGAALIVVAVLLVDRTPRGWHEPCIKLTPTARRGRAKFLCSRGFPGLPFEHIHGSPGVRG